MSRRIGEVEAIFADIEGVYEGAQRIAVRADVLTRTAAALRQQPMPDMPGDMVSRVAAGLVAAAGAADRMVRQVDEELTRLERRMQNLAQAVLDEQKTNMSKAQGAFERFVNKHDRFLDAAFRLTPAGNVFDGGSFTKGFGGAALGTVDIVQLGVRNAVGDPEAGTQLENLGTAIARDPKEALKAMVSYDLLTKIFGKGSTGEQRHEAASELAGGIGFDAVVALLTGGVGTGASRGSQSLNAARRGAADKADLDLQRGRQKAEQTQAALRTRTQELSEATRAREAAKADVDITDLLMDPFRWMTGRRTKLGQVQAAATRQAQARRRAGDAARERDVAIKQVTAQEVVFRDAQKKLRSTHIDTIGLRAAAGQLNDMASLVGAGVPTTALDIFQSLVQAVREAHRGAADAAPARPAEPSPRRRT